MLVLYLLDVSYWEGVALVWLRRVCLSVTGVILLLGATMATGDMPYAPIILFLLLLITLIAWLCRTVFMAWAGRYVKAEEAKGRKPRETKRRGAAPARSSARCVR